METAAIKSCFVACAGDTLTVATTVQKYLKQINVDSSVPGRQYFINPQSNHEVIREIEQANIVLLLFGKEANQSLPLKRQAELALNMKRPLYYINLEGTEVGQVFKHYFTGAVELKGKNLQEQIGSIKWNAQNFKSVAQTKWFFFRKYYLLILIACGFFSWLGFSMMFSAFVSMNAGR